MTDTLASALAELQKRLPEVRKGETAEVLTKSGGKYTYSYADLADCSKVILPKLGEVGLSFSSKPTIVDGQFVLVYTLRHVGGDTDEGVYPLPDPTRHSPQEIGSAITYGRRYSLCAITGLAPGGDDDDGAAASKHVASQVNTRRSSKPPRGGHPGTEPETEMPREPSGPAVSQEVEKFKARIDSTDTTEDLGGLLAELAFATFPRRDIALLRTSIQDKLRHHGEEPSA